MWEHISYHDQFKTFRMKVPGGWIVRTSILAVNMREYTAAIAQTFVADSNHEWKLEEKSK